MTALEMIAINRAAYTRKCRRHIVYARLFGLLRQALLVLALTWCYTSRHELGRMIYLKARTVAARHYDVAAQAPASRQYTYWQ